MCCWLVIAFAFAPRVALVFMWLFTGRIGQAFDSFLIPLIGFFLLPWTTLIFVLVAPGGIGLIDVVLIVIALVADLGSWGGGYRSRSSRS